LTFRNGTVNTATDIKVEIEDLIEIEERILIEVDKVTERAPYESVCAFADGV